jgi:hypothetical protein
LSRVEEADHVPPLSASAPRLPPRNDPWFRHFDLLVKYKAEHNGSCDVPQKEKEGNLGNWVNKVLP